MFDTKKDVDKHVRTSLAKLRTDSERNLRGYTIAKLYFKIGEYSSALQFVTAYLTVKNDSPQAHRLQGQCLEKLGKIDKALQAYQISLHLNSAQPELLTDVCKLSLATDTTINSAKARYWCQMADKMNLQNESVLNLKLKLLNKDNANPNQVEDLILKEIMSRPLDVTLRIRLIEYYLEHNRVTEAFSQAFEIESKQSNNDLFALSLDWYNTLSSMLAKYKNKETTLNWPYWLMCITTIERQLFLMLCTNTSNLSAPNSCLTDCTNLLFEFDQLLEQFSKTSINVCPELELAAQFLSHFRGQFCLHAATLIFKRELVQTSQWKEATKCALPLLLLAYNCGTASTDDVWLRNNTESRRLIQLWNQHGAFRCSQAGRTLLSCMEDRKSDQVVANIRKICSGQSSWTTEQELIAQIRQFCSNTDWRKQIFKMVFRSNHLPKQNSSFFMNCSVLSEPRYDLPSMSDLEKYEEIAQWLHQSSLTHMVYLTIESTSMSDVKCNIFKGLNFSISNLLNCGAETLNQLDVESFLYAATLQAKRKFDVKRMNSLDNAAKKPSFFPFAIIASDLCTEEQKNWWSAAYKVFKNISGDEIGEIRTILQHGIEAVRAIGGPKIDLLIALHLGEILHQRARDAVKVVERGFLEARVEALYKYSLQFIKIWNNRSIEPCPRFFKYAASNDTEQKTNQMAETAVTFLAERFFRNQEYEECIDELSNVNLPFASYFQAEAYRKLNELNKTPKKNKRIYIEKAIDCLNQTLHLLNYPYVDPNHPLKSIVNSDIERLQQMSKTETSFLMNGSQMAEDFLDTSVASNRTRREAPHQINTTEMENMLRKMMETLSLVKEDVADVKIEMNNMQAKLQNIEEQINKNKDSSSVDPNGVLDDYFIIDDELQNQSYLNNAPSMYPAYQQQRMHTPNQIMQPLLGGPTASQQQSTMNPYSNSFYNNMYPMGLNPYQAALAQRASLGAMSYADPTLAYSLQQQASIADPRNTVLGLLTQQTPISQTQPQSQIQQPSTIPLIQQIAPTIPQPHSMPPAAHVQPAQTTTATTTLISDKTNQNSNILKTWNSAYNNAPVEKAPPVNVVITNSDPLPIHTAVISQQPPLSVTIPSHHIKNNAVAPAPTPTDAHAFSSSETSLKNKNAEPEKDTSVKTSAQVPKSLLSSLTSTAIVSPHLDKQKDDPKSKPNPFANFSFGSAATSTPDKPLTSIFSGLSKTVNNSPILEKSPKATDQPSKDRSTDHANISREDMVEDYVPTAQFEPVIALPELIDVKTGEENEIVKFEHRAKLLRYVKETKEWKERGIGNIKLLVNQMDPNLARLIMRRDQVLKLCCNQLLKKDTKFSPLPKTETALSWYGQDFSENEIQVELLAIRFKTAETCKKFHEAILDAQRNMSDGDKTVQPKPDPPKTIGFGNQFKPKAGTWNCTNCYVSNSADAAVCLACKSSKIKDVPAKENKPVQSTKPVTDGFGEKFKPKAGTWNCTNCYVSNSADAAVCLACKSSKVKDVPAKENKPVQSTKPVTDGFGEKFKPKPGSWACKSCYLTNTADAIHCIACESPKDDSIAKKEPKNLLAPTPGAQKFTFGVPMTNPVPTTNTFPFGTFTAMTTTNAAGNLFSVNSSKPVGGFSLTPQKEKAAVAPAAAIATVASLPEPAKLEPKESFSFVFKPKSPGKAKSPTKTTVPGAEDISDDENVEEEENNTYFTPVIPLPDKIEVKTGEEDEDILYTHRCKLFRFVDSEWKERGLGDIKILQHKQTNKLRVVMRREQILKICLNHALTRDVEYKPKDEKSWHFVVIDFSEGEVQPMQFCVRFKTKEIAQEFKEAVENALNNKEGDVTSTSDVQQKPVHVPEEIKQKSSDLKLPIEFFIEKSQPCQGCRGCNSDEFKFPELKTVNSETIDNDKPLPLVMPKMNISPAKDVLKQSAFATKNIFSNFNQTLTPSRSGQNIFSITSFAAPETKSNSNNSMFGQTTNAQSTPAFGVLNLDSNQSMNTSTTSFGFGQSVGQPIFGGSVFTAKPTEIAKPAPIFGENSITPVFGATNTTDSNVKTTLSSFVFGNVSSSKSIDAPKPSDTTSLFGTTESFDSKLASSNLSDASANTANDGSFSSPFGSGPQIFGSQSSGSIFGGIGTEDKLNGPEVNTTVKEAPVSVSSTTPNLDVQKSIFGNALQSEDPKPIFGGSFGSSLSTFGSIGSNSDNHSIASNEKEINKPIANVFGNQILSNSTSDVGATTTTSENMFKTDPNLSFASLAQSSSTAFKTNNDSSQGFYGLTTKDDFSSLSSPTAVTANQSRNLNGSKNGDSSNVEDSNYDPHYEPIIALPDEIVVSTGEEEESKIFGERSKIYRFDATSKEWKERGVGELKILYHPGKGKYRLLLRREQVYKCVVNQSITSDLIVSPMKSSDKAYCWATNNFADESNGDVEKLSARFKNPDNAQKFYETIQTCIEQLKSRKSEIEPEED